MLAHARRLHTCTHSCTLPCSHAIIDILVVACGCPELVRADWVKPGAVVLDVGINVMPAAEKSGGVLRSESEASRENASAHHPFHVVGDVCFAEVSKVSEWCNCGRCSFGL